MGPKNIDSRKSIQINTYKKSKHYIQQNIFLLIFLLFPKLHFYNAFSCISYSDTSVRLNCKKKNVYSQIFK
jgi:hypothetical protein